MTPVLGDPNVTAFLKVLSLHRFCSTCTPTTCQLHVVKNSFTLTTDVSHTREILQRTGMQSFVRYGVKSVYFYRHAPHLWYPPFYTSVDSGNISQAPPKQSAVCSTSIIPAPPTNCQFIWMASAFGMSPTQPILG